MVCLRVQEKCRATKELITDLELMANADYFVGSSTSGVPGVVATLRLVMYKKSQVRAHASLASPGLQSPSIPTSLFWSMALPSSKSWILLDPVDFPGPCGTVVLCLRYRFNARP